jgi:hypothetical protein
MLILKSKDLFFTQIKKNIFHKSWLKNEFLYINFNKEYIDLYYILMHKIKIIFLILILFSNILIVFYYKKSKSYYIVLFVSLLIYSYFHIQEQKRCYYNLNYFNEFGKLSLINKYKIYYVNILICFILIHSIYKYYFISKKKEVTSGLFFKIFFVFYILCIMIYIYFLLENFLIYFNGNFIKNIDIQVYYINKFIANLYNKNTYYIYKNKQYKIVNIKLLFLYLYKNKYINNIETVNKYII